jgi:hypothetical protein
MFDIGVWHYSKDVKIFDDDEEGKKAKKEENTKL